jgi:phage-related protein
MRKDFFIFDNLRSSDFGIGIYGDQLFNAPERDCKSVSVPGRNGNLIIDSGNYKNIPQKYKAFIIKDVDVNLDGFRDALLKKSSSYYRLEDTIKKDEFRLARALPFDVDIVGILKAGKFTVSFDCKPQRFLKSGEIPIEITSGSSIFNHYSETALPLIRVYGNGTLTVGSVSLSVADSDVYTDIDSDLQECYKDSLANSKNSIVTLTNNIFPKLLPGENQITFTGFSKVEIIPRWWIV